MNLVKTHRSFGGKTQFWKHPSVSTGTEMSFSTFVPEGQVRGCLIWLSGLTCTEENFITKSGAQKYLAEANLAVVCPDTSPRGLDLPHEHEAGDFGSGAGFYVDATTPGYAEHYHMYSYVSQELYGWVEKQFDVRGRISISGHSMGGHGALVMALREPQKFRSVSAFSPIVNPMDCPWGRKAFAGYLGEAPDAWEKYDTVALIRSGKARRDTLLVDQGTADPFLERELFTQRLIDVCNERDQRADIRMQPGYDHSYYFIATFIEDHIGFHAAALRG